VGTFYTSNDWSSRGNILRHNFVHLPSATNAFYVDDGDCGDEITGNLIYRAGYGSFIRGGHNHMVRSNPVIEGRRRLHLDARGIPRHYNTGDRHKMQSLESVDYRRLPTGPRSMDTYRSVVTGLPQVSRADLSSRYRSLISFM
jgi:hypothetical protein